MGYRLEWRSNALLFCCCLLVCPAALAAKNGASAAAACVDYSTVEEGNFHTVSIRELTVSPDDAWVASSDIRGTVKLRERKTGATVEYATANPEAEAVFSQDSKMVAVRAGGNTIRLRTLATGAEKVILYKGLYNFGFTADGRTFVVVGKDANVAGRFDVATGKFIGHAKTGIPGGPILRTRRADNGDVTYLDTAGVRKEIKLTGVAQGLDASFTPDRNNPLVPLNDGTLVRHDLTTGREKFIAEAEVKPLCSMQVSADGKKLAMSSCKNDVEILDFATKARTKIPTGNQSATVVRLLANGEPIVATGDGFVRHAGTVRCVDDTRVIRDLGCAKCNVRATPAAEALGRDIARLQAGLACSASYDPKLWTPIKLKDGAKDPIERDEALRELLRLQKPGAFRWAADMAFVNAVLRSDLSRSRPELVRGMLEGIFSVSAPLYKQIIEKHPEVADLPATSDEPCRTDEDRKVLRNSVWAHLQKFNALKVESLQDIAYLKTLGRLLARLDQQQKDQGLYFLTERMADSAKDTPEFSNVFPSKLYKLIHQEIAPWFGEPAKSLTDVAYWRDGDRLRVMALGVKPINDDPTTVSRFGISSQRMPSLEIDDTVTNQEKRTYQWTHDGRKFSANVSSSVTHISKSIVPAGAGPDYPSMWKDKKLVGVVLLGVNMANLTSGTINIPAEFLEYYTRRGFVSKGVQQVDTKSWLSQKIKSGEADYMIKQAHADGDENNIFRMPAHAEVEYLEKKLPDGKTEGVYITKGAQDPTGGTLLSNQEFGSWIQERETHKGGQLMYISGSCWEIHLKALNEISAASSDRLLVVGTTTITKTFMDHPRSTTYQLLESFRAGGTYKQMRDAMATSEGWRQGVSQFRFPGDPEYTQYVNDRLQTKSKELVTVKTLVDVRDQDGKGVHIDE